ncbi:hypothetical protein [Atlantibacter hermannii]|uniref:hypothetical protein n=1 Tax=Atlantibacter hermannii TaxID=565 RepID=UPI002897A35D|nr:hypothetical protein [Atlantibacter hermannii]
MKVIDHFKVVVRHTDGTYETGKSRHQPTHQMQVYAIWQGEGEVTVKLITLANVVSVSTTPVYKQQPEQQCQQ